MPYDNGPYNELLVVPASRCPQLVGLGRGAAGQGARPRAPDPGVVRVPVGLSRRRARGTDHGRSIAGSSCVVASPPSPWAFAAPGSCPTSRSRRARSSRNLVVLYLAGGNDSLSTVVPYSDPQYYARRPTIGVPAGNVLQVGSDRARRQHRPASAADRPEVDLRPGPAGHRAAHGLSEPEPIALPRAPTSGRRPTPNNPQGSGWLGTLPRHAARAGRSRSSRGTRSARRRAPCWRARSRCRRSRACRATCSRRPTRAPRRTYSRQAATRIASHVPVDQPHLAFVNGTVQSAMATIDRVAQVGRYAPHHDLPDLGARRRRSGPWRARSSRAWARRCSGCRRAGSTRTRARA